MVEGSYQVANSRNEVRTIGTDSVKISEMLRPGIRQIISLSNRSTAGQTLTISIGRPGKDNEGIPLLPGYSWVETEDAKFNVNSDEIWVISDAIGGTLSIYERIKVI